MGSKAMQVFGTILVVIAGIGMLGAFWVTYTYADGVDTQEENEEYRDLLPPGPERDELDKLIEENKDLLSSKKTIMAICWPVFIVSLIAGILLLVFANKRKKAEAAQQKGSAPLPPAGQHTCPTCNAPTRWIQEHKRHWCDTCKKYL